MLKDNSQMVMDLSPYQGLYEAIIPRDHIRRRLKVLVSSRAEVIFSEDNWANRFYRNERGTLKIDFMVRDADSLVPIGVKANDSATASLNALIEREQYSNIKYGAKLSKPLLGVKPVITPYRGGANHRLNRWF